VEDNYLLGQLWPYLVVLFEAPSTLKYVGFNSHEQQQLIRKSPHWNALRDFAWSPTT
jgi:hypothetical protein